MKPSFTKPKTLLIISNPQTFFLPQPTTPKTPQHLFYHPLLQLSTTMSAEAALISSAIAAFASNKTIDEYLTSKNTENVTTSTGSVSDHFIYNLIKENEHAFSKLPTLENLQKWYNEVANTASVDDVSVQLSEASLGKKGGKSGAQGSRATESSKGGKIKKEGNKIGGDFKMEATATPPG